METKTLQAYDIIDLETSAEVRNAFSTRREYLFRAFLEGYNVKMNDGYWAKRIMECNDAQIALGYGRYA